MLNYADRITAVFDTQGQAQAAVDELRQLGVKDAHFNFIARQGDKAVAHHGEDVAAGAGKGLLAGAGVGALFGVATMLIPAIGPFVVAGTLFSGLGAVAGAAAAGAVVGGTAGAVAGALAKSGYTEEEAHYYGETIEKGGILVAVDLAETLIDRQKVRELLHRHGGRTYGGWVEGRRAA